MKYRTYKQHLLSAALALTLAACGPSEPQSPPAVGGTGAGTREPEILGVVKVDFQHIGQADFSVNATVLGDGVEAQTLARTGSVSFTQGARGSFVGPDHARYLYGQLNVNNTGAARSNLMLLGINAKVPGGFQSLGDTSLSTATRMSGTSLTALEARQVWPMHRRDLVGSAVQIVNDQADFQAYREADITPAIANYMAASPYNGYAFPFGFMARSKTNANTRAVPVGTAAGTVTLAFRYSDANASTTDDLSSFSWTGLIVADTENRVTADPFEGDTMRACAAAQTLYGTAPVVLSTLRSVAPTDCGRPNATTAQNVATVRTSGPATAPTTVQPDMPIDSNFSDLIPAEDVTATIDPSETVPMAFAGGEMSFSAVGSVGNALTYSWNFGDGTTEAGDPEASGDVTHVYANPGIYTATLTVADAPTNTTKTSSVKVSVLRQVTDMVSARKVDHGQTVQFDVGYPLPGLKYHWAFSDGQTLDGPAVSRTFTTVGMKDYDLTVYKDTPTGMTDDTTVAVQGGHLSVVENNLPKPRAYIAPRTRSNGTGYLATFNAADSVADSPIVSYTWNFGDGTTGTGQATEHTYASLGRYAVTLQVKDTAGQQEETSTILVVDDSFGHFGSHTDFIDPDNQVNGGITSVPKPQDRMKAQSVSTSTGDIETIYSQRIWFKPPASRWYYEVTAYDPSSDAGDNPDDSLTVNGTPVSNFLVRGGCGFLDCIMVSDRTGAGLKSGQNVIRYRSTSRGANVDITTNVSVVTQLRVPHVTVNIIPDTQLAVDSSKNYTYLDGGHEQMLTVVNIRESETSNGMVRFDLPLYAVKEDGSIERDATGDFNAGFQDANINSSVVDNVMVNGVARLSVGVSLSYLESLTASGGSLDLGNIVAYGGHEEANGTPGGYFNNQYVAYAQENGVNHVSDIFSKITTNSSHDLPLFEPLTLKAQSNVFSNLDPIIQRYVHDQLQSYRPEILKATAIDKIGLGRNSQVRTAIDTALKNYDSSTASFVLGFVPILGDGISVAIEGYHWLTNEETDPVILTLSSIGLTVDLVPGAGEVASAVVIGPIKAIYKSGGKVTRKIVAATIDEAKTKGSAEGFRLLKLRFSFLGDFAREAVKIKSSAATQKYIKSLDDALSLSAETQPGELAALDRFVSSYDKFKGINPNLSAINKLKIAKYGILAPETAKAMAKCGSECIIDIENSLSYLKALGSTTTESINIVEKEFVSLPIKSVRSKIITVFLKSTKQLCPIIKSQSIISQAVYLRCVKLVVGLSSTASDRLSLFNFAKTLNAKRFEDIYPGLYDPEPFIELLRNTSNEVAINLEDFSGKLMDVKAMIARGKQYEDNGFFGLVTDGRGAVTSWELYFISANKSSLLSKIKCYYKGSVIPCGF